MVENQSGHPDCDSERTYPIPVHHDRILALKHHYLLSRTKFYGSFFCIYSFYYF